MNLARWTSTPMSFGTQQATPGAASIASLPMRTQSSAGRSRRRKGWCADHCYWSVSSVHTERSISRTLLSAILDDAETTGLSVQCASVLVMLGDESSSSEEPSA